MVKIQIKTVSALLFLLFLGPSFGVSQEYFTPKQLVGEFEALSKVNPSKTRIHRITTSPGGNQVIVLEIGTEVMHAERKKPAIFVAANPEGTNPLSSYAVVSLARQLVKNDGHSKNTWYILPVLNPDALARFFHSTMWENSGNNLSVNEDMDDAVDEDGPNDLNKDGFITDMRVKDPQGIWMVDPAEPRLLRRADRTKGEKGIFTLYLEGTDDDGDGLYNEDPPGGVNTGINFPHLFRAFTPTSGQWPGSTPEVYGLMKFIFDRPEIAATFTFGATNFALVPPEGGRRGSADFDNITLPDNVAEMFGVDKSKKYTMDEIIELAQPMVPPGVELTPATVASFLGLGAIVNPLPEDLAWYKELSEQYLGFLKSRNFNIERLEPEKAKDGSFELWSYYHLGVPTFSFNFFSIPKVKEERAESSGITMEQLEKMSSDEFISLGVDKINSFLKENNAPEQFSAQQVIGLVRAGQTNPRQMAGMMKTMPRPTKPGEADPKMKALLAYNDNVLGGKGYISWQPINHPTLGQVEIGGSVPYLFNTPPASAADSLINVQLPWIFSIVEKLPKLVIGGHKTKSLGSNVYSLDVWIENSTFLPFPTAMGKRNNQPAPAVLIIESDGVEMVQGLKRTPIRAVDGLSSVKVSYVLRMTKGKTIQVRLESKSAGHDSRQVSL